MLWRFYGDVGELDGVPVLERCVSTLTSTLRLLEVLPQLVHPRRLAPYAQYLTQHLGAHAGSHHCLHEHDELVAHGPTQLRDAGQRAQVSVLEQVV